MSDEPKIPIIEWGMMDKHKFFPLTVVNSFFSRSLLYPFVLVKTRLQIQKQNTVYNGMSDAFKKIIKSEGFCGLYKGFWVNSTQVFSGIFYIVFYEKTRDIVTNYTNISDSRWKAFLSGGISSAVVQTLIIPTDIISQHIMLALNSRNHFSKLPTANFKSNYFKPLTLNPEELKRRGLGMTITRQLWREGGWRSFYRGYSAVLLLCVPSSACWWTLYQEFNNIWYRAPVLNNMHYIILHGLSGVFCGACSTIMTNPFDVLRANVQVHRPSSYKSAVRYLWKEDKWRIFSKGLTPRLVQSCFSSCFLAIGYEIIKKLAIKDEYRDQVRW